MLIKRTKERSQEITPDNRGVIWGKELNGMATDEELYGQYLSGDETGLELLIKKIRRSIDLIHRWLSA